MAAWPLFLSTIVLPLFSILLLWIRPSRPRGAWLATLFAAAGITSFSVLAAPWGWFGLPARLGLVVLFGVAVYVSLRRPVVDAVSGGAQPPDARPGEARERKSESPLRSIVKVLIALFFGRVAVGVLLAHQVPPGAVDLRFPLAGGAFLVAHGGSTTAANLHGYDESQRYALDIVKLNALGTRARGLVPDELDRYAVWSSPVVSPCSGTVISALDGLPDLPPGQRDEKNKPGNHVIVRCGAGDVDVMLAHLQRGTVRVKRGQQVASGAVLGLVGNSGNTTEPHLHVHAERGGKAVPATFDGRWLVRNAVVRR